MVDETFMGLSDLGRAADVLKNPSLAKNAASVVKNAANALIGQEPKFRRAFLQRLSEIPSDQVDPRGKQIVDQNYFSTALISGLKNAKFFTSVDTIAAGVSNTQNGKLESGKFFTLSAIQVVYGVGASGATSPVAVDFGALSKEVRNGYITVRAGGRTILEKASMELFRTPSNDVVGLYHLANPKMIQPQQQIEVEVEWGTAAATDSFLKVGLWGAGFEKA